MNILEARNISKKYANHQALKNISLSIPQQSIYGLLGPNGAGKTTFLRIINQIIVADEGEILIEGHPLHKDDIRRIGYLPEERGLYKKMKVGEQLLYLARLKGLKTQEAVSRIKLWFEKLSIHGWYEKKIEDLSKGMQQKIQFIATVVHDPDIVILDEPFTGFDPVNANLIRDEILDLRQQGKTIIFSTHRMESVEELCSHIALINKSEKVLEGPKKEIKNHFKSHTYQLIHKNTIEGLSAGYQVLDTKPAEDNFYQTFIKIDSERIPNHLLTELIQHNVEIHAFEEVLPSIHDIFVRIVKEENHA